MEYFLFMVFVLQVFKVYIVQGVYVSKESLEWEKAIKKCDLATPKLTFNKGVNGTAVVGFSFRPAEDVWIGYFKEVTLFQYIGCQNKTGHDITAKIDKNSPGACLSSCIDKTSPVGLSDKECYCISTNKTQRNFECTEECSGQKGIACGNSDKISIYRAFNNNGSGITVHDKLEEGDCVRVENVSKYWYDCTQPIQSLCYRESDEHVFVVLNGSQTNFPWRNAANRCFMENSTTARLQDQSTGTSPVWIGVIRSTVVYDFHSYKMQSGPTVEYLYLGTDKKVHSEPSGFKKYLCANVTSQTDETAPTTTASTMNNTDTKTANSMDKDGTAAAVGVSIAVVVVVIIVITVIIFLKRRNVICTKKSAKPASNFRHEQQEQDYYSEIPDTALTNGKVEYTKSQKINNLEHKYHTVEKQGAGELNIGPESTYNHTDVGGLSKATSSDATDDQEPGYYVHTYFVLENQQNVGKKDMNDTYNVTGDHKVTAQEESDNVYNKLDDNSNATYDHMHKSVCGTKSSEAENTYDTKDTVMKTGNTPRARGNQVYRNVGEAGESDTYHHLGVKTPASTDNFYGAPENSSV